MTAVTDGVRTRIGDAPSARTSNLVFLAVRVGVALLWIQNAAWKLPPDFGRARNADLFVFVNDAVEHPVVAPWSWVVQHVVLPNFVAFGWMTLLAESAIGAFLLMGLATRLFALLGVAQSGAIALSVLNTPGEWHWSYYLMIMANLMLFAVAAGRAYGVDAVLRPLWLSSPGRLHRLMVRAS